MIERLGVQPGDPRRAVGTLSGGNQQKVLFGKWLWHGPRVLIADEPTRGVDVGAKFAIYALLAELAASGMAILLISEDLDEILALANRIVVLYEGELAGEVDPHGATVNEIGLLMAGGSRA